MLGLIWFNFLKQGLIAYTGLELLVQPSTFKLWSPCLHLPDCSSAGITGMNASPMSI